MDVARFKELKEQKKKLELAVSRAQGELQASTTRLKEEYGVNSPKEALTKLNELEEEAEACLADYEEVLGAFEETWGEQLKTLD